MAHAELRTTKCRRHGHAEVTLVLDEALPVPGVEKTLVSYFEDSVARGAVFKPGETVQFGWAMLRIRKRRDGTLGVEEIDRKNGKRWRERVGDSLMEAWLHQEVARSVGVTPAFPTQGQSAIHCLNLAPDATHYMMSRSEPTDRGDSGWFIGCCDDDCDHNALKNLSRGGLLAIGRAMPFLVPYFALPWEANLHIAASKSGPPIPTIYIDGKPRKPKAGSYLASLIKKRR
jgi:hypothetical protein